MFQGIWIILSLIAAFGTASWNFSIQLIDDTIRKDSKLKFIYIRFALIICGFISLISLFIPKIGISMDNLALIKKHINVPIIVLSGFILFIYQVFLIYAFASGGSLAAVIINLNLPILIIAGCFFLKQKIDIWIAIGIILYTFLGSWISWYKYSISNNIQTHHH